MMNQLDERHIEKDPPLALGIIFTILQVSLFFFFIVMCVFDKNYLSGNFMNTEIPLSFVMGFCVIICGVVLTAVYVSIANGREEE